MSFFNFFLTETRYKLKERKSTIFKKWNGWKVCWTFTWSDFDFNFQAFVMLWTSNKVCISYKSYFTVFSLFIDYQNFFHTFSALFYGLLFSNNIRHTINRSNLFSFYFLPISFLAINAFRWNLTREILVEYLQDWSWIQTDLNKVTYLQILIIKFMKL